MFPVATLEAREEAEQLAGAFATDLNKKAGREVAAAKVTILKLIIPEGFHLTMGYHRSQLSHHECCH